MARQSKGDEKTAVVSQSARGKSGKMIEPCLLLLLHEKPAHGYDLIDKLVEFGFEEDAPDPGTVYRNLRRMEEEGLVKSTWITEGPGPAKRLYEVTPQATELLGTWIVEVEKSIERLENFLQRLKTFARN
ncbi:MAG: helix-turn-helix transcriptional regulator [Syntrophomonadaceae bacterium]|nr:helix-turn-helix transcriptional regulator [Syntrophomonadaceae bacterium]